MSTKKSYDNKCASNSAAEPGWTVESPRGLLELSPAWPFLLWLGSSVRLHCLEGARVMRMPAGGLLALRLRRECRRVVFGHEHGIEVPRGLSRGLCSPAVMAAIHSFIPRR
jgi:hypothetical protein